MNLPVPAWRRTAAVIALALFTHTPAARAQQGMEPLARLDSVPATLATAMLSAGGLGTTGEPRILVGSAPEWVMPKLVVPSGARVAGSAFLGTSVLVIVSVPAASDTVLAELQRQLLDHGWKKPPMMPQYGGGFRFPSPVNAAYAGMPLTRLTLCDGAQMLFATVALRDPRAAYVAYRVSTASIGTCVPPQFPGGYKPPPYPVLWNPAGSVDGRLGVDCPMAAATSYGTGATLKTALKPDAILDHYEKQLLDSGWTAPRSAGAIAGRTFTRPDSTGALIELTLTVTGSTKDASCQSVSLQVRTPAKP